MSVTSPTHLVRATPEIELLDRVFTKTAPAAADWLYWSISDDTFFPSYIRCLAQGFHDGMGLEIGAEFTKVGSARWRTVPAGRLGRVRAQLEGLTTLQARVLEVNEAAESYARAQAGRLVQDLTKQQTAAVNDLVARGLERGWTDQYLARQLQRVVGLDTRYADAVSNYRQRLMDGGMRASYADQRADDYARSLLRTRTTTIARTEMAKAINEGQRFMWLDALDGNVIPTTVRCQWVLHPSERTCDRCRAVAGSVSTPLSRGGTYSRARTGTTTGTGPPLHPNCRCTERLVDREANIYKLDPDVWLVWLDLLDKHYQGEHDQLEHGNWARGRGSWRTPAPGETDLQKDDPILKSLGTGRKRDRYPGYVSPATGRKSPESGYGLELATRNQVLHVRQIAGEMAIRHPVPTDWEIFANGIGMALHNRASERGGTSARKTGSLPDRNARAEKMKAGPLSNEESKLVCVYTGRIMPKGRYQEDRIVPAYLGGRYTMWNLVPVLGIANKARGEKDFPFGTPKWATKQFKQRASQKFDDTRRLMDQYMNQTPNTKMWTQNDFIAWLKRTGRGDLVPPKKLTTGVDPARYANRYR